MKQGLPYNKGDQKNDVLGIKSDITGKYKTIIDNKKYVVPTEAK